MCLFPRRWSVRELFESGFLVHGASKINRLLRLTTLVMPRENMKGLCRPDNGECALKIEGHSYAMVESGSHDNASLQFYLLGPDGDKARSLAASGNNAWGGPVDAEVVTYFSKVLELTHPDVRNVVERLRDDASQAEFSIVVDDSDTCNVHRTHSAVTAMSFANTTRHRDIVMKRQSAPNEYDRIPPDHPLYEQLTYPMYYWFGEKGWHSGCAARDAKPRLSSFQYAKGRTHMPEVVHCEGSLYCRLVDLPVPLLLALEQEMIRSLTCGGNVEWPSLFEFVEKLMPLQFASAKQLQNAWDTNEHVRAASGGLLDASVAQNIFDQLAHERDAAPVSHPPTDVDCVDSTAPNTPHLIRCRKNTTNTVDLEHFPTLSYEVETAEFTDVLEENFTYKRQTRRGRSIRLPASRWQLSPWLGQEYALDSYCRTLEESFRYLRNNQSKLLRYHRQDTPAVSPEGTRATNPEVTTGAAEDHGSKDVYLPSSVVGSRKFLSNKTADGLAIAARLGNPLLFITVTTNKEWHEIRSRIPVGASPYDYPDVVCRVFHHKLEALRARLLTGAAWGASNVSVDEEGNATWVYNVKDTLGKGYIISVIEFQQRGMPHAHIVLKVR